jgi:hypothetical protein
LIREAFCFLRGERRINGVGKVRLVAIRKGWKSRVWKDIVGDGRAVFEYLGRCGMDITVVYEVTGEVRFVFGIDLHGSPTEEAQESAHARHGTTVFAYSGIS